MSELYEIVSYILLQSVLVVAVVMALAFVISLIKKDNSIVDTFYGATFITLAVYTYIQLCDIGQDFRATLITLLVIIWGTRLSYRIWRRNKGRGEDFRYKAWRDLWMQKGRAYFTLRSIFQIYVLQGLIILTISLPVILANTISSIEFSIINGAGLALWLIGFFFEAEGDHELDSFIRNENKQARILQTGLWRYSRHPNYFGEALMWWGIFLMVFGMPFSLATIASPILISFLLRFVSGVPMLEKKWQGDSEYESYKAKTNAFVPWFPKNN